MWDLIVAICTILKTIIGIICLYYFFMGDHKDNKVLWYGLAACICLL